MRSKVAQLCCNSLRSHGLYSPAGSSIHEIFQARGLEWVAISFSRGSSRPGIKPRSPAVQADTLPSAPPGTPQECVYADPKLRIYLLHTPIPTTVSFCNHRFVFCVHAFISISCVLCEVINKFIRGEEFF